MGVAVAKANLLDALKDLRAAWQQARTQWDDAAAERFQREVIEALEPKVAGALKGIDQLAELMAELRRDCGDD